MFYTRLATCLLLLITGPCLNARQPKASVDISPLRAKDSIPVSIQFSDRRQSPRDVPVRPSLSRSTPYFDGGMMGKAADSGDYEPFGEGSFIKKNGHSQQKYVITTGVWRMLAGDEPVIGLALRDTNGRYARPGILPDLGVRGKIRLEVSTGQSKRYLEEFTTITTTLSAGEPAWICWDSLMKVKVTLTAHAFLEDYGCALIAQVESASDEQVTLNWHYEDATPVRDASAYTEFSCGKYTQIFVGSTNKKTIYQNGLTKTSLAAARDKPASDTLLCIWGYRDYDRDAVERAYKRLRFRPFPSAEWTAEMKKQWFHHWIGRGLEPERKFLDILKNPGLPIAQSKAYWESMRNRVRVKTGDARFDNVVQSLGSRLISDYEYPGYTHGSNYMKYGKINCGMYGDEAAGFHDEVASTLKFLSGTADVKGRLRYIEPDFMISQWAEEMNPYFIDQVWYHYRWTGDTAFLVEMWPSVRRSLEHFISTSNPSHDGFFTGYYENWNGDGKSRGGTGALWTAMAIKALRVGYDIATLLDDVDWDTGSFQITDNASNNDFRARYKRLLLKAGAAYETRYNKEIGAFSSSEWNAGLRNMPGNEESDYAIWREIGDPLENYTTMRFIRDNYHQSTPNGVIEYCNKDWPVCWSNHYDSYAEAMSSIASAAMANDMDNYWPLLKTASERVYTTPECTAIAGGGSQLSLESDQMFMMAVLDNVFGIKPYFGKNLLVIRPSFPKSWKNPEIDLPDVSYKYFAGDNEIRLTVETPVDRILQAEIPVRREVKEVLVNGRPVDFKIKKEVNYCRIIVRSEAAARHEIKLILIPNNFSLEGNVNCILHVPASFRCNDAEIVKVEHPQNDFGSVGPTAHTIQFTPEKTGKFTLFAEVRKGNVSWFQPVELNILEPWSIREEYQAWSWSEGAAATPARLLSPEINSEKRTLQFQLSNNLPTQQSGAMLVEINGHATTREVTLLPGRLNKFEIPLDDVWTGLSRGTLSFKVKFRNEIKTSHAVDWQLPVKELSGKKIIPLDLRNYYNISLAHLYGSVFFKWRIDYTGAAVGVDWRDTLYVDRLGYKLFSAPTSVISYGVLPEQMNPAWWSVPFLPETLRYPVPFSFIEHAENKMNVIALVNAENNRNIPSEAVIELKKPVSAEKIYMLTANLTKTCKSYYPAAEVEIVYESGKSQSVQLIPPYNMPSLVQTFCPDAFQIPLGEIEHKQIMDFEPPGLSVTDLPVTDTTRRIKKIVFRCVASETVLGIIGISLCTNSDSLQ
ncbi:MAG: hypothetical protein Q8918_14950 [Bacteroidota bacterium]|nr:hypothetical protein [Bacteroidota bacterium]